MKNYPNFTFRNPNPTFKFKAKFKLNLNLFANVKKMHLNSRFQFATPFFFCCCCLPLSPTILPPLSSPSLILPSHLAYEPPSPHLFYPLILPFITVFPLCSFILHPPPSASLIFLIAAFRKSSHLEVLTAFSRQKPASLRDLNRGEMCDGYLPETL